MSGAEAKGGETPVVSRGPTAKGGAPKPRSRWRRRLLIALAMIPLAVLGLWIAIHRVDWLGPWLADLGRSIVGNDAIARLEDFAYGVEDRVNRATKADEAPKPLWDVPPETTRMWPALGAERPR